MISHIEHKKDIKKIKKTPKNLCIRASNTPNVYIIDFFGLGHLSELCFDDNYGSS